MEVIIQPTQEAATAVAAQFVAQLLREKPRAVLGLPTGNTPLPLYRELVRMKLDWHRVTTFNLDEYVGLSPQHPASYHSFMHENLFRHINITRKNIHIPDGMTGNIPGFCEKYEQQIRDAGGIDLQLLGIGVDGHIGFNEPSSSLASRMRMKTLTARTRRDNAKGFGGMAQSPHHVITMGIGTIMEARHCLLLAFGRKKAKAIAGMVEGPVTAMNPASALQLHPKVTVYLDEPAASRLKMKPYYRWIFENKPSL
ncbi:MAG TPA: glucosamine-6-phosphate deaminase [Pseudomonadales bacterium]|nr:glucosamine-6-phosphate deaminase [Pseudomonadales bacterium]